MSGGLFLWTGGKLVKYKFCLILLTVSACGPAANDPGPGGVSVEDARALDAAAEKLDQEAQLPAPQAAQPAKPTPALQGKSKPQGK